MTLEKKILLRSFKKRTTDTVWIGFNINSVKISIQITTLMSYVSKSYFIDLSPLIRNLVALRLYVSE